MDYGFTERQISSEMVRYRLPGDPTLRRICLDSVSWIFASRQCTPLDPSLIYISAKRTQRDIKRTKSP